MKETGLSQLGFSNTSLARIYPRRSCASCCRLPCIANAKAVTRADATGCHAFIRVVRGSRVDFESLARVLSNAQCTERKGRKKEHGSGTVCVILGQGSFPSKLRRYPLNQSNALVVQTPSHSGTYIGLLSCWADELQIRPDVFTITPTRSGAQVIVHRRTQNSGPTRFFKSKIGAMALHK